jgi:vitamin B12 transporter
MPKSPNLLPVKTALAVALLTATSLTHPSIGRAQQSLPGLVVQGATLEPPPKPVAAPQAVVAEPKPVPQPAPKAAPKAAQAAPAPAPAAPKAAAATAPAAKAKPAPQQATAPSVPATSAAAAAAGEAGGSPGAGDGPTPSTGGIAADKVGTSVSVVTAQDIKNQQIRNGAEALRSLPGVSVSRSGTSAGLTQVRIRGAEGNHTLVLIDGIVANSATDGEFDFSDLSADDIERIEVIRGAQSGLYGSGAIGGVINIITKGGKGPLTVTAKVEGGSMRTRDVAVGISGGNDKGYVAFSGHVRESAGFNVATKSDPYNPGFGDKEDSRLASFSFKAGGKVGHAGHVDVVLKNINKSGGRDSDGPFGFPGIAVATENPAHFSSNALLAGVNLRFDMMNGALTHVLRASRNDTTRIDDEYFSDTTYGPAYWGHFENRSITDNIGYLATYRFATPMMFAAKHSVSGLLERQTELFQPRSDATSGDFTRSRFSQVVELRSEFADRLFLTNSVRHDDNDKFKDFTTWRSSASLKLPELGLRPHASAGTGVKLPSQFEQFGAYPTYFTANPNLKPEESIGWDAGIEFTTLAGRALIDVTYFRSTLTNKIEGLSSPVNVAGQSLRQGVELAVNFKASSQLTLGASYTYLDAHNALGEQEARRSPNSGRVDANYRFDEGRGNFNLAVAYNGQMRDKPLDTFAYTPVTVTLKDYTLVTAGASYKLQPGIEVFGRVENLLNQKYQEVYGYNTPGATAFAGMRFTHVVKPLD